MRSVSGRHRRAGRQAVIHEDHRFPTNIRGRPVATIQALAPRELLELALHHHFEDVIGNAEPAYELMV
jgi:hypothetical protein